MVVTRMPPPVPWVLCLLFTTTPDTHGACVLTTAAAAANHRGYNGFELARRVEGLSSC